MKKPALGERPRPPRVARRQPQTRSEAAVELVRLEFDAARLDRELDQLSRRMRAVKQELSGARSRADSVLALLTAERQP
ncbi:MAG: hypothetical protein AAGG09_04235 [Pseudomonadota bacterium]